MSDLEQLAARLVEAAADAVAHQNPFDLATGDSTPTESEINLGQAVTLEVLRVLVAKPDGYLRYQEDGGITYTKTLRGLADFIEKGTADDHQ